MAAPKLNQINALVTGHKSAKEEITKLYHIAQKPALFEGRVRTYKPDDEEHGERLPAEFQKVQVTAESLILSATATWADWLNMTATQDAGNQRAKADVVVDGTTVFAGVPIAQLLFLDHRVNDLETFIQKLPVPDASEDWHWDANQSCLVTTPSLSIRTTKQPDRFVKYEATKEHPAQVEFFHRDVRVGSWSTIRYSGCIPSDKKSELLLRVRKLKDAIKVAKEQANSIEVEKVEVAAPLFNYLFGDLLKT
jgi:hypothetical protein